MASGDDEAAAAFVRRFQSKVYGLALGIVRSPTLAEDVAQEAFVKAWRYAGAYDSRKGRVAGWMMTITRNLAIDAVRSSRQQPTDADELMRLILARDRGDDTVAGFEDTDRLRRALRELPSEQIQAVLLSVFYGLTAKEIGTLEGIPVGTVKSRVRRGLMRLRDRLEVHDE
ncbi:MAG: RNA polymerase sigma factor [Actinomycetota bacterium]